MPARLLVVEDSRSQRAVLCEILRDAGHDVTEARDGLEGEVLAVGQRFDLVITDVEMPRQTGIELTRRLRLRPEYESCPIVIMSTRGDLDTRVTGLTVGALEYLVKPVDRREVVTRVAVLLELGRSRRALEERNQQLSETLAELRLLQTRLVASEKLAYAGRMASGIAHESNSPLQALSLNLDALEDIGQSLVAAIPPAARHDSDVADACDDLPRVLAGCKDAVARLRESVGRFRRLGEMSVATSEEHVGDLRQTVAGALPPGMTVEAPAQAIPARLRHAQLAQHLGTLVAHVHRTHQGAAVRMTVGPQRARIEITATLAPGAEDLFGEDFASNEGRMQFDLTSSAAQAALARMGIVIEHTTANRVATLGLDLGLRRD